MKCSYHTFLERQHRRIRRGGGQREGEEEHRKDIILHFLELLMKKVTKNTEKICKELAWYVAALGKHAAEQGPCPTWGQGQE